jgi:signal peptidase II
VKHLLQGRGLLFGVAAHVLLTDQISKALVLRYLNPNQSWNPIPGLSNLFSITQVTNTGAAFGLFQDRGMVFVIIAIVVIIAIFAYYHYLPSDQVLVRISLGLLLGGALGNLLDRLHYGYVVDFLDFKFWPVFNIADSSIVVGVIILAIFLLREQENKHPMLADAQAGTPSEVPAPPFRGDPGDSTGRF